MPMYGTYTWTLDYSKSSDFDDNVGHWQVMKHPDKQGWSRVLYSCELKLPEWLPAIIVNIFMRDIIVKEYLKILYFFTIHKFYTLDIIKRYVRFL